MKNKIVIFLFLYLFVPIYFVEALLAIKNHFLIDFRKKRHVILSEHIPSMNITVIPTIVEVRNSEGLIRKKYRLRIDDNGFIMPSKINDNPDITIVFLGGSTTECLYVEEGNRFPYLVGRILERELGKKINSYNSGVAGNSSRDSLNILLNKVISLKPNIVIMMHNLNDLDALIFKGGYWKASDLGNDSFFEITKRIISILTPNLYMHLCNIYINVVSPRLQDSFLSKSKNKIVFDKLELNNEFRMNLQTFINICTARKIVPVLMTQENRLKDNPDNIVRDGLRKIETNYGINYREFKEIFDLFNDTIREVGRDNNILVIDLAKEIPQTREFLCEIFHFNDNGSRFATQIISRELKKILSNY